MKPKYDAISWAKLRVYNMNVGLWGRCRSYGEWRIMGEGISKAA
jgi:hypothetical protein